MGALGEMMNARDRAKRASDSLEKEVKRLKARVKMLQKLRHQVVITVSDPRGPILRTFTLPHFVYEKNGEDIATLTDELEAAHNQTLAVHCDEDLIVCDTFEDLRSEIDSLNEIDDQKEEDGVEG